MSDDLEIIKSSKSLYVGWAKGIKYAAVSAMTKSDTVSSRVVEVVELIRKDIRDQFFV